MFITLVIAGGDNGQLRPGLAGALAEGKPIVVLERQLSEPVALAAAPKIDKEAPPALPPAKVVKTSFTPVPAVAAATREATPAPVFTLSALPSLGVDQAALPEPSAAPSPDADRIWVVDATAVNVRTDPSASAPIVDQLARGEAVTVFGPVDSEWVEVRIEGDGVSGYVASRFLAPAAP